MLKDKMRPVHPGDILREDVLMPLGMSERAFAERLGVPTESRVADTLWRACGDGRHGATDSAAARHDSGVLGRVTGRLRS